MQPGDTITPNSAPTPENNPLPEVVVDLNSQIEIPPVPLQSPTDQFQSTPVPTSPEPPASMPDQVEAETTPTPWQFKNNANSQTGQQSGQSNSGNQDKAVTWTASEYVAHHKNMSWFVGLGLVVSVVTIVVYFISHDFVSPVMILLMGVVFGVFAARKPDVLDYGVNSRGLTIGQKFYAYENFKTFSVHEDGPIHSIVLAPLQRFMPPISIYYEPTDEDPIIDVISQYLPFSEARPDAVDSLMRRVRF